MTHKEALRIFRELHTISKTDAIANREAFHVFTDSLCKNGQITSKQYHNWSNPY